MCDITIEGSLRETLSCGDRDYRLKGTTHEVFSARGFAPVDS